LTPAREVQDTEAKRYGIRRRPHIPGAPETAGKSPGSHSSAGRFFLRSFSDPIFSKSDLSNEFNWNTARSYGEIVIQLRTAFDDRSGGEMARNIDAGSLSLGGMQ
jgi:hypothetical protein